MNRWTARVIGVLMLLIFILVFLQLYKQLVQLQKMQSQPATTSTR